MINIGDNFSYKGKKPLDARLVFDTIVDMTSVSGSIIYDGILVYNKETNKYYNYKSSNSEDLVLGKWRELITGSNAIKNAIIDKDENSLTYNHLLLTLSDDSIVDCGYAVGAQGNKGDGFVISKIYESKVAIYADLEPVSEGAIIALIETKDNGSMSVKTYIRKAGTIEDGNNLNDYVYFCDLADATVIRGPEGPKGDKGATPVVSVTGVAAADGKPRGQKITFTTTIVDSETGETTIIPVDYTVYNGKDGLSVISGEINDNNHLILIMSDESTIDCGELPSGDGGDAGGAVVILGRYKTADVPNVFSKGDVYYNITTKKIYTATDNNVWGTAETPKSDIIYISISDLKAYCFMNNDMVVYGEQVITSPGGDNAIFKREDGLWAENLMPYIDKVNERVDNVNKYQKYVDTSLNSCECHLSSDYTLTTGIIPFKSVSGNINVTDGYITLEPKQRFQFDIELPQDGNSYKLLDVTNSINIMDINKANTSCQYTNESDDKCRIGLWCLDSSDYDTLSKEETKLLAHEINRIITIDPMEHINGVDGIEDLAVGHIASFIGTEPPKHYLKCDNGIYLISKYPELAEFIKEQYGVYNYFGGDGATTFATPLITSNSADVITCIKYEPTYFVNFEGAKITETLVENKEYTLETANYGITKINEDITMPKSLDNYDELLFSLKTEDTNSVTLTTVTNSVTGKVSVARGSAISYNSAKTGINFIKSINSYLRVPTQAFPYPYTMEFTLTSSPYASYGMSDSGDRFTGLVYVDHINSIIVAIEQQISLSNKWVVTFSTDASKKYPCYLIDDTKFFNGNIHTLSVVCTSLNNYPYAYLDGVALNVSSVSDYWSVNNFSASEAVIGNRYKNNKYQTYCYAGTVHSVRTLSGIISQAQALKNYQRDASYYANSKAKKEEIPNLLSEWDFKSDIVKQFVELYSSTEIAYITDKNYGKPRAINMIIPSTTGNGIDVTSLMYTLKDDKTITINNTSKKNVGGGTNSATNIIINSIVGAKTSTKIK